MTNMKRVSPFESKCTSDGDVEPTLLTKLLCPRSLGAAARHGRSFVGGVSLLLLYPTWLVCSLNAALSQKMDEYVFALFRKESC